MKKIIIVMVMGFFTLLLSCGAEKSPFDQKKSTNGNEKPPVEGDVDKKVLSGDELYSQKCAACHGRDGNMGVAGAKKIPESVLTIEERVELISNGKKTMPAFKGQLSEDEIKTLAEYTMTLK